MASAAGLEKASKALRSVLRQQKENSARRPSAEATAKAKAAAAEARSEKAARAREARESAADAAEAAALAAIEDEIQAETAQRLADATARRLAAEARAAKATSDLAGARSRPEADLVLGEYVNGARASYEGSK